MTGVISFGSCLEIDRAAIALLVSVGGGVLVTLTWSEFWHWYLARVKSVDGSPGEGPSRDRIIGISIGVLERAFLTSLVIWLQNASGPLAATWIIAKAAMGWDLTGRKEATLDSRRRYAVHLMNSLVSIFWALAWGVWGT